MAGFTGSYSGNDKDAMKQQVAADSSVPDWAKPVVNAAVDSLSGGGSMRVDVNGNDGSGNPRDQSLTVSSHNH